ncbi:very short patch repair endonuclease, partial [Corynebacterium bovis]
ESLRERGWLPLHYWEHDEVDEIADEVEMVWRWRVPGP